jgi:hypothetical protein
MPWVRIDDNFPTHPKVAEAGPLAAWLYICGLCYCQRHLTDGFIPRHALPMLMCYPSTNGQAPSEVTDSLAHALVEAHLWQETTRGYLVHDYLKYQQSRAQVEHNRTSRSRAAKIAANARWHAKPAPGLDKPARHAKSMRRRMPNASPSHPIASLQSPTDEVARPCVDDASAMRPMENPSPGLDTSARAPMRRRMPDACPTQCDRNASGMLPTPTPTQVSRDKEQERTRVVQALAAEYHAAIGKSKRRPTQDLEQLGRLVARYGADFVRETLQVVRLKLGAAGRPLGYLTGACKGRWEERAGPQMTLRDQAEAIGREVAGDPDLG